MRRFSLDELIFKAPKPITHGKLLLEVGEEAGAFWRSVTQLGEHFGGVLLQVAPNTPYDPGHLRAALQALGDPRRVAVEFRAEAWDRDEVRAVLEELGAARVSVDAPRQRLSDRVTGRLAYLRLHGRRRMYADDYSGEQLAEIAALARRRRGLYFFNSVVFLESGSNWVNLSSLSPTVHQNLPHRIHESGDSEALRFASRVYPGIWIGSPAGHG